MDNKKWLAEKESRLKELKGLCKDCSCYKEFEHCPIDSEIKTIGLEIEAYNRGLEEGRNERP